MVTRKIMMAATSTVVPNNKQQNVILFLTLENVSGREIHTEMCVVWCTECYYKINCELMGTEIQGETNEYE